MSEKKCKCDETCNCCEEKNGMDSWITSLEEKEQPEACSIDNPDCENCGS